jgi:hypothetical protein
MAAKTMSSIATLAPKVIATTILEKLQALPKERQQVAVGFLLDH